MQALRAAQESVTEARESRARTEARLEGARTRRQDVARHIREALGVAPEGCLAVAGLESSVEMPPLPDVERKLAGLKGDRERLGGVNLQADDELITLGAQVTGLDTERADVEQAIAKLRAAIGQLNREAHKRLADAFEAVDAHFRKLFTTLFGGGEARLEMVEGEDPLEGGLEIIAKPPGKKPATLSLLSGGEQSLTALSLIFAVFLTNPSPICVLDEVDAPLDDANVDRFCRLLEAMAIDTDTNDGSGQRRQPERDWGGSLTCYCPPPLLSDHLQVAGAERRRALQGREQHRGAGALPSASKKSWPVALL